MPAIIKDDVVYAGGGNSEIIFSTDEQECGKWIDGKTLYRRIITFTNTEVNENFQTDIPSNTIDTVFIGGNSFCNKDLTYSPLNLSHTSTKDALGVLCSKVFENVAILVRNGENGLDWNYYVELFYTKK